MALDSARRGRLRRLFVRFRGGPGFILTLAVVVIGWISWNLQPWLPTFDAPPFVLLNLLLSIEAAFTMPVLWMEQKEVAADDTRRLMDIANTVKTVLKLMEEDDDTGAV